MNPAALANVMGAPKNFATGMLQNKDAPMISLASKELGMGRPPPGNDHDADEALAMTCCAEDSRFDVVESAEWQWFLPMTDASIGSLFGANINPWGTPNGNPPPGIAAAYNTLTVPGLPNGNMIIWGLYIRIAVESEGRLIRGNYYIPPAGSTIVPGSPDVFTAEDLASGALGIPAGGSIIPGELLYGLPTWKAAYAMTLGYGLNWFKDHQESLIRQPLKTLSIVEPFSRAEAAGLAYSSNIDRIAAYNNYTGGLGLNGLGVFLPTTHKRLGTFAGNYAAGAQGPDVTVTREEDASPTVFGGIGKPQDKFMNPQPLLFSTPMFWPRSAALGISFEVINSYYQAEMQRWMSITGGVGGQAGQDLNLPISNTVQGFTPAGAATMNELSLDLSPVAVNASVTTNRMIGKMGTMNLVVGLLGKRVREDWMGCVARMVKAGALQTPQGYGDLATYIHHAK